MEVCDLECQSLNGEEYELANGMKEREIDVAMKLKEMAKCNESVLVEWT